MKRLSYIIIFFGVFSCMNQPQESMNGDGFDSINDTIISSDNSVLHIYRDQTPIYKSPSDKADVIQYANYLDSFRRYNFYIDYNGITEFDGNAQWYPVMINNDTGYLSIGDIPLLRIKRESFCSLDMIHFFKKGEWGGMSYFRTRFKNQTTGREFDLYVNQDYSNTINDSLFLLNHSHYKVGIYQCFKDTFIYESEGKLPVQSNTGSCFYYYRNTTPDSKNTPLEIVKYDYLLDKETIIYTDSEMSTDPCLYFPDGQTCNDIEVKNNGARDILNIEINKLLDDLQDEGDYIKYKIVIDLNDSTITKTAI